MMNDTPNSAPVAGTQQKTPGFNFKIPEKIMTPDTVETRIGTLEIVKPTPTALRYCDVSIARPLISSPSIVLAVRGCIQRGTGAVFVRPTVGLHS